MEASEYGLTHGTCFSLRWLEVVAVARLLKKMLSISWRVYGAAGFRDIFRFVVCPSNYHVVIILCDVGGGAPLA